MLVTWSCGGQVEIAEFKVMPSLPRGPQPPPFPMWWCESPLEPALSPGEHWASLFRGRMRGGG